jgi:hypothetical protein
MKIAYFKDSPYKILGTFIVSLPRQNCRTCNVDITDVWEFKSIKAG